MSRSKRRAYRQSYYADYCQDTRPARRKLPNVRAYRTRYGASARVGKKPPLSG